ncbi:MAG: Asp23/Gls24 family envelope stress response protein [Clostridiales bacterium]|nr:Asp23/Gls24 family envelope stress response protein [Clostridiales bacterium]
MKIYSLVGKSGTGKSFQAIDLCHERGIACIIDDGLLIGHGMVLAGKSAKRQDTRIGAIRTALFTDETHREEVMEKIRTENPDSLLIVGTSERMTEQIADRLGLPRPKERIAIETITTSDERRIASYRRHELGQHIIPAPTFEVRRDFSGYFLHPIKVLRDMRRGREDETERSLVRPTYSYFGNFSISDRAIRDIVKASARFVAPVDSIVQIFVHKRPDGVRIDTSIIVCAGTPLLDAALAFQGLVKKNVEEMTSMNLLAIDVKVADIVWRDA